MCVFIRREGQSQKRKQKENKIEERRERIGTRHPSTFLAHPHTHTHTLTLTHTHSHTHTGRESHRQSVSLRSSQRSHLSPRAPAYFYSLDPKSPPSWIQLTWISLKTQFDPCRVQRSERKASNPNRIATKVRVCARMCRLSGASDVIAIFTDWLTLIEASGFFFGLVLCF